MDIAKLRPHADTLVVKEDGLEQTSEGGILLGRGQIEPDHWLSGRVVAVGNGRRIKNGSRVPVGYDENARPKGFELGDRICFRRGAGMELEDGHLLLKEDQIVPALLPDGFLVLRNPYVH